MVLTDEGWSWEPFWETFNSVIDRYNNLVKKWNRRIASFNAALQDVGRPLAASEAQARTVTKLHKAGKSMRYIADETNLGLRTVRTIVGRIGRTDRTSRKRLERIDNKHEQARWRRQKRQGDALPKQVEHVIETGNALVKEAKGLGRAR